MHTIDPHTIMMMFTQYTHTQYNVRTAWLQYYFDVLQNKIKNFALLYILYLLPLTLQWV